MKNNTKLIIALVAVAILTAIVVVVSKSNAPSNLSNNESNQSQTGEFMDENLSNITKAKQKLKDAEDAHAKNQPVDANVDARTYVEAIVPIDGELEKLAYDARYGDGGFEHGVREMIEHHFGKDFSQEKFDKIITSGLRSAYRSDKIEEQFAYGTIDKEFYRKATLESSRIVNAEHQEILTNEEYLKYMGGTPEKIDQDLEHSVTFSSDEEFFLSFPAVQKGDSNIKSVAELQIDEVIVSDMMQVNEEHVRSEMRTNIQFERGEIDYSTSSAISDQDDISYRNYIASILTPEQENRVLGENWREKREEDQQWMEKYRQGMLDDKEVDDEEFDDTPVVEGSEEWNELIAEGAEPEAIRKFHETDVLEIVPKEQK